MSGGVSLLNSEYDASGNLKVNIVSGGTSATPIANNSWGQSLGITSGATSVLVNIASSTIGYQVKGFIVHGTGDGYWTLQVTSTTIFSGRTRSTMPTLVISLPNGISIPTGSVVSLKVTNESGSTADYEATLLGI